MPTGVGFNPSMYLKAYRLAKEGLARSRIAEALGTDKRTFKKWVAKYPALKEALDEGYGADSDVQPRKDGGESVAAKQSFKEYCLTQLPPHLADVWRRLDAIDETEGEKRYDMIMADKGRRVRQEIFLHSLVHTNFNKTAAMRRACVSHAELDRWVREDPDFLELVETINVMKKDFVDGCLFGLIAQGDSAATIFASKTLNRDRGYGQHITVEQTGTRTVKQLTLAKVIHKLPTKQKRRLLAEYRAARELPARVVETTEVKDGN